MTAIAIFVKTPGLSPVKTRLAAGIGRARAEEWHCAAAQSVAELAQTAEIGPVYFAVAEDQALDHPFWSSLPTLPQGQGGLGSRMHRIHHKLVEEHGAALLLGADTVQWDPTWLREAAAWLENEAPRLVLGPASDGGFWTFGANQTLPEADWVNVDYGCSSTGKAFRSRMDAHGDWLRLPQRTDLDRIEDQPRVLAELESLEAPTEVQRALADRLRSWLPRT
ncbi:TIGR04282 family arsenosugar biosynthesis glycosyltransferase [Wenzhouxiangella marina]|uniref:Uncharacterized protein n=1 Tax=Wenzhouxiangella marina TaxID=1579979 RepID=A0A0K0XW15_9GAMM|nr:DUF2064 domain-containing protein [Wenzhouxiangella marina]AKS41865.1 hypothetical protein WM2015_1494 [Wenzhouxiangella marina]MBB6086369.1 hypothetical protein [Wenzhouxiangella marina]